ncbi:MAG: hypothetical protein AAB838_00245 [Patescibacteria group bacterium]
MTVSKNVLLALIAVVTIALLGIVGFILVKPKTVVAPEVVTVATPTPTPTPVVQNKNQIKLVVDNKDGSIVKTNKVIIKGVTIPKAEVFINDLELVADAKGNFSGTITLEEGDNPISIIAVDENGNSSEEEITVTYEP